MLSKKKHHFIQLVVIFSAITILTLLYEWGIRGTNDMNTGMSGMMGESMGDMMSSMHAGGIKLSDMFEQQESMETINSQQSSMESHHGASGVMKTTHYFTTAIIVILLPFIFAGSAYLAIMWLK